MRKCDVQRADQDDGDNEDDDPPCGIGLKVFFTSFFSVSNVNCSIDGSLTTSPTYPTARRPRRGKLRRSRNAPRTMAGDSRTRRGMPLVIDPGTMSEKN